MKLSAKSKAIAKASAKRAGRPYPNLVDNMNAAKNSGGKGVEASIVETHSGSKVRCGS